MAAEIHQAVVNNNFLVLQKLMKTFPASELQPVPPDETPLISIAASLGHIDCVQVLIENHADVNTKDAGNWTPLMYAMEGSQYNVVQYLLDCIDCDVTVVDDIDQTVLHIMAMSGTAHKDILTKLLHTGVDINACDIQHNTPLMKAVEFQNYDMMQLLIEFGADLTLQNEFGKSVFHYAAATCRSDIIHVLLEQDPEFVTYLDCRLQTPLMVAAQQRRSPIHIYQTMLQLLQNQNDSINACDNNGNTALLHAIMNPMHLKKKHIQLLISSGSNVNSCNNEGLTPIWQTVYDGIHYSDRIEILQLLLRENCIPDYSCRGRLLFTTGLNAIYCYETPITPLEVAVDSGYFAAAKMLLLAGCYVTEEVITDLKIHHSHNPTEEVQWFLDLIYSPPSLLHLARLHVRKLIGKRTPLKVTQLPLPDRLKGYLLMDDLKEIALNG